MQLHVDEDLQANEHEQQDQRLTQCHHGETAGDDGYDPRLRPQTRQPSPAGRTLLHTPNVYVNSTRIN